MARRVILTDDTNPVLPQVVLDKLLATTAETIAGTSTTKANTPAGAAARDVIKTYRSTGAGDQTAALQAFLDGLSDGDEAVIVGAIQFTTVTCSKNKVLIRLGQGAVLTKTTAATDGIVITGADVTLTGGRIVSPATWDGTNVAWTYATIHVKGARGTVRDVALENVPKVGIGFRDVDSGIITGCRVVGNYPTGQWTGVETAHFGIAIDPSASAVAGNFVVSDNIVESCVQGVFIGNYGVGSPARGVAITGNVVYGCWNHGVYSPGSYGTSVASNTFNRCQTPVALTGSYHVIVGNTMVTTNTGDQRDVAGISLRDPIGCIVLGNTIKGDAVADSVVVDVREIDGTVVRDNIVAHNVIEVTNATSNAIRIGNAATTCENNIVQGNRIRGAARTGQGAITVNGAAGSYGNGNQVLDNEIVLIGAGHGVYAGFQRDATIRGNKTRLGFDAAAAVTLAGVTLSSVVTSQIGHNSVLVEAAWGTNVTMRGIWESTGVAASENRIGPNAFKADMTKLAAATALVIAATSGPVVDESGAGAPNLNAGVGSRWWRTDGGAATTFYVKESGTGATGWVGK